MKSFLFLFVLVLLALSATFLGGKIYESHLQEPLRERVVAVMEQQEVREYEVEMEKLDVHLRGIVASVEVKERVTRAVQDLKGTRLLSEHNDLKVAGQLKLEKIGETIIVEGQLTSMRLLAPLGEELIFQKGARLVESTAVQDVPSLKEKALQETVRQFLSYQGPKSIEMNGEEVILSGTITEELRRALIYNFTQQGLQVVDLFTLVDPLAARWSLQRTGMQYQGRGSVPAQFEARRLGIETIEGFQYDPFVEGSKSLSRPDFCSWVKDYFAVEGDRALEYEQQRVTLTGASLPSLSKKWSASLAALGYEVKNQLTYYPSRYHFPSYLMESFTTGGFVTRFTAVAQQTSLTYHSSKKTLTAGPGFEALYTVMLSSNEGARYILGYYGAGEETLGEDHRSTLLDHFEQQGIERGRFEIERFERVEQLDSEPTPLAGPSSLRLELLLK